MWVTPGKTSCSRRKRVNTTSSSPLKMKGGSLNKGETEEVRCPRPRASTKREAFCRREIRKMGPICKSRKREDDHVIPFNRPAMDEEIDLDKQFGKGQVFDDRDSTWLSSDNYSPTSFFEDYRLSGSLRASVDDWLVSWLSTLASSYLNIDKGGAETEKVKLKLNHEDSVAEESASCSLTSSASPSGASSEAAGFDGASLLVSLLDLDDVDSERVLKLNCFPSGFPSPSCGSIWSSSEAGSSSSCNVSTTTSEGKLVGRNQSPNSPASLASELDSDEPIFWPFERELEWSSEKPWSRFSMSPRRDTPVKPRPALPMSRRTESDARESCRRRLMWDSNSADSEILQSRGKTRNNVKRRDHHPTPPRPRQPGKGPTKFDGFAPSGKHPIEAFLGLGEFDGHEGVGSDFNCDSFDLH